MATIENSVEEGREAYSRTGSLPVQEGGEVFSLNARAARCTSRTGGSPVQATRI